MRIGRKTVSRQRHTCTSELLALVGKFSDPKVESTVALSRPHSKSRMRSSAMSISSTHIGSKPRYVMVTLFL
jgi:hypothetical protein